MLSITRTFADAFYSGAGVEFGGPAQDPVAGGVWLLGRQWMVDTANPQFGRRSVPQARPQQDNEPAGGPTSLASQVEWQRSPTDWSLGAGQVNWDTDERSNRRRFDSSRGVDVWHERGMLTLLPATELARANASALQWVLVADGNLWHVAGDGTVAWSADGVAWNAITSGLTSVVAACSDGQGLYLAADSGLHYVDGTTKAIEAVSITGSPVVTGVWWAMERLFIAESNVIHEVLWDAVTGTLDTLFDPGRMACAWVEVLGAYGGVFLAGNLGSKAVVYRVTLKADGTGWEAPVAVLALPDGEEMVGAGAYLGFLFVSSTTGIRLSQVNTDGSLTVGGLNDTPGNARCFEGEGQFVWAGQQQGSQAGLVRMNLAEFATDLAPAWASDLEATDTANGSPLLGETLSVTTWQGKRWFTVEGEGLVAEHTDVVLAGTLDQGIISMGITNRKVPTAYAVYTTPLAAGASVAIDVSYDAADPVRVLEHLTGVRTGARADGRGGGAIQATLTLRALNGVGPQVLLWEIRAAPTTHRVTLWTLPLLIADQLDMGGRMVRRDVVDDARLLMSAALESRLSTLRVGRDTAQVKIMDFEWQPQHLSLDRQAWQGTMTVQMQTLEGVVV